MLQGIAGRVHELKAQGAVEAAQDPNSSVSSHDAEKVIHDEARAGGSAAFSFNPDASPEEKAAQINNATAGVETFHRPNKTAALATDRDDGPDAGYDLPTPTKDGVITAPVAEVAAEAKKEEEEEYAKVGFAPRFGNPTVEEGTLLDHQDFLEGKLSEKLFGDWYHNAGVIVFACLSSWTVAVLGGGLGWVFIIMAACGTYYRTSIRRVRRNFRDDMTRELAKNKLETDVESLEWINSFLVKFWPIYAPVLCKTIVASVDQVLSTSTPAFLDSMRMRHFTLGTKPPRLEHVKTYPRAEDDIVIMDWKFSFTPNDTADMTARQIKTKVNPKVILEVRVGKAMLSKGLDIIVEDMACTGLMRVKMKLQLPFPHIDRVDISFLGRPTFDYVCKPIGGEMLGFDINFVPGLEKFIQETIHATLGPMMYDPNVFPIEIAKMLAGNPVDQAIGVLQVTFHGAQGLKNPDKFSGTPDPYAVVSINNREALGRTKTVQQNANPRWSETINVVVTSLREPLTIQIFDYNEYRKDKALGVATFNLEQLETQPEYENEQLEVIANGRPRGVVQADIRFFPVLEGKKLADGTEEPPPESLTGIAKFTVEQAKDLDGTKSLIGELSPYAVLLLNGKEVTTSRTLKRTNNPIWDNATQELLINDRSKARLGLVIKDSREVGSDPVIGTYQIKLDDMLDLTSKGHEWYQLAGAKTGRAKMMLQWKPVALKGSVVGSGYVTPIGVMRFHFKSATDLKNLDKIGKSDPYARVLLSGVMKGRTVTWQNNLNPEWDEVFYVPVHTARERLIVEVMDEENTQADRTLGQLEIPAADYINQTENGEYLVHDSKNQVISAQLRMGTSPPKGTVNFTVAFYPTIPVVDPEQEEREKIRTSADTSRAPSLMVPPTPTSPSTEGGKLLPLAPPRHERSMTAGTISSIRTTNSILSPEEVEMRKALNANEKDQVEMTDVETAVTPKLRLTVDDLAKYDTGLLIFKIHEAELAHTGSHLEVVMDDMRFAAYTSAKTRNRVHKFNETGDAIVRELDLSRITLRLVADPDRKSDKQEDSHRAKINTSTLDALKRSLYIPHWISLKDEHGHESRIKISMKYLPIRMQLDPSESINNQGNLRVEILDAADLPAADRNGYSDPFCRFSLNGADVHKTAVQKKTLHPAWNEFFEVNVSSRTAAKFECTVWDWDFADKPDFLGAAHINLDLLEPFQAQELTLRLDGKSGSIRLKLLFKPDYVTRARQGTSVLAGTFAAPGKIIGAPVKGVGRVASGVGHGVFKGATFVGRGFKKRGVSNAVNGAGDDGDPVDDIHDTRMETESIAGRPSTAGDHNGTVIPSIETPNDAAPPRTPHMRQPSSGAFSTAPGPDHGTASFTVQSIAGFEEKEHKLEVVITQETTKGPKEILKTKAVKTKTGEASYDDDNSKSVLCSAAQQFKVSVRNHKTFGGSDEIAEAPFFVNDQSTGGEQEINCGPGVVVLKTSFQPSEDVPSSPSASMKHRSLGRFMTRRDRSVTPSS